MAQLTKQVDFLVIGAGSGGLACARRASTLYGVKTMIIEANRLGGTCVNVGCVPKKITWHAANIRETLVHDAKHYGFSIDEKAPFNWLQFKQRRDSIVERLNRVHENNLGHDNVEYIHGLAQFVDPHTVKVTDGENETLVSAKRILIAVGGYPTPPTAEGGIEHGITSDGFFELEKQPKKVAVIGAGYIAVELAGMFNALGTETHLFIRHDKILRTFDPMIQDTLMAEFEQQGIVVHTNSSISRLEHLNDDEKMLHYKDSSNQTGSSAPFDCVLWAIGRTPAISKLRLDLAKVEINKDHIKVDAYQNTSMSHIYAIGDVCDSGFSLTPVAIAAGRRLADRVFGGLDAKLDYTNIPSVVFSHPEVGCIGLTEPEARKQYGNDVKVYTANFKSLYYSIIENSKAPTSYKIVCVGPEERVVGLHIIGLGSSEILQGFGVAIKMGATKADFDRCVAIHPTNAEELVTMK